MNILGEYAMNQPKVECELCGSTISKSNYKAHLRRHELHPETFKTVYKINHEGLNCCFCGKLCSSNNSLTQHEIRCKNNPDKIESSLDGFNTKGRTAWNKGLTKETDERVLKGAQSLKDCYRSGKLVPYNKGKQQTDETKAKISASMKNFLLYNPNMIPYVRNHSSKVSYPEAYFLDIFKEYSCITYHHRVGLYELDFCNIKTKRCVEIDGDQHILDDRIVKHDQIRTQQLQDQGWIIKRILWSEYKKLPKNKQADVVDGCIEFLT